MVGDPEVGRKRNLDGSQEYIVEYFIYFIEVAVDHVGHQFFKFSRWSHTQISLKTAGL